MTKKTNWVVEDKKKRIFWPSEEMKKRANISDPGIYAKKVGRVFVVILAL